MRKKKGSIAIEIVGKPVTASYDYEEEDMKIGSGDNDHPGYLTLDILELDINAKDLVYILDSYRYTEELMEAIKVAVLAQIR